MKYQTIIAAALALLVTGCVNMKKNNDSSCFRRGAVCFTFDDSHYEEWIAQLPLFEKYDAHVTFFFDREITPEVIAAMKTLQSCGHTVGLHGQNHKSAVPVFQERGGDAYVREELVPQMTACANAGLKLRCFAYPYSSNSTETDALLMKKCGFTRFRGGVEVPKGGRIADHVPYYDFAALPPTLKGCGIGPRYECAQENLDAALERAAKENKLIVFYSHNILEQPGRVDISIRKLSDTLAKAHALGMAIVAFDELPEK